MFDYDKESKKAVEILDKYNLANILKQCHGMEIYHVADKLKEYNKEIENAISSLSAYELSLYLENRYQAKITEEIIQYFWWNYNFKEGIK